MKKLLLFLLFPLSLSFAQSYTYKPLLSTTDWRVCVADLGGDDTFWYHQAFKIKDNNIEYTAITDCDGLDPIFYIREDISSRKVFFMRADDMQEHLLFNFNLKVGETMFIPLGLYEPNSIEFKVHSIDTITLSDGKHKRFFYRENTIDERMRFTLIEGVGCTDEPFKVFYRTADPVFYLLNTYKAQSCQYVLNEPCPPNPCTSASNISNTESKKLVSFPNPCTNSLQIKLETAGNYCILNHMGQVVLEGICINEIDVSTLSPGMYTLHVTINNGLKSSLFIKE
jgi:hypothetical protein